MLAAIWSDIDRITKTKENEIKPVNKIFVMSVQV